ncbi:hypothetical protein H6P81_018573 [Aristolochia fimbriata]|uniref:Pentatricopeptide repeat-containing protein n=1 Tax=Aristolochia fimbriata TaxID=158543 RepID=A0AAV7E3G1_ARIFI|nr:hypothetical protein H6P81_018573 [Aristolochia fimbriata]
MYAICGDMTHARLLFDDDDSFILKTKNTFLWNFMIRGYVDYGAPGTALSLCDEMLLWGQKPDNLTFPFLLEACGDLSLHQLGMRIHGQTIINIKGLGNCLRVRNSLIDTHASVAAWSKVFDDGEKEDVVSWTAMIGGYDLNGNPGEAFLLSHQMLQFSEIKLTSVTLTTLLSACLGWSSSLKHGISIHRIAIRKYGQLRMDIVVETALIDMYAKCGQPYLCHNLFTNTSRRKTVPWNAVISGYTHKWTLAREAVLIFNQMRAEAVPCNTSTIIEPIYELLNGSSLLPTPSVAEANWVSQGSDLCHQFMCFRNANESSRWLCEFRIGKKFLCILSAC